MADACRHRTGARAAATDGALEYGLPCHDKTPLRRTGTRQRCRGPSSARQPTTKRPAARRSSQAMAAAACRSSCWPTPCSAPQSPRMLHAGVALRCGARFGCLFACPTGCFGAAEIGTADVSSGSVPSVRDFRVQSFGREPDAVVRRARMAAVAAPTCLTALAKIKFPVETRRRRSIQEAVRSRAQPFSSS